MSVEQAIFVVCFYRGQKMDQVLTMCQFFVGGRGAWFLKRFIETDETDDFCLKQIHLSCQVLNFH